MNIHNTEDLDKIIEGRVEPQIYAFETNSVPSYLKVGDTYRPLEVRLDEWRVYFPDLKKKYNSSAQVDENTIFRDYSVHQYLEEHGFRRLEADDCPQNTYYSREFFKDASEKDVEEAVDDIKGDFKSTGLKYNYFKYVDSRVAITQHFERKDNYDPRPNQKEAIENFEQAINKGRTNLLMYAVMRFGKSFTAMCCAESISAKLVVVVSGKADVKLEWKKTVESHIKFSQYEFVDSEDLKSNFSFISNKLKSGNKLVVFVTLQDLAGSEIKGRHEELFKFQIDLLIIDETHFGVRAPEYGRVFQKVGLSEKDAKLEYKGDDSVYLDEVYDYIKVLSAKVKLHLSGTPYRILMGYEFEKDDIISFCQFSDIVDAQEQWDKENRDRLLDENVKEWDNPYYGFPQMVRFAFNPSESVQKKLAELRSSGNSFAFSALLRPESIEADDKNMRHTKFTYEQEVLDLFEVIDGSKQDNNVLGFLDYDKIKDGNMCRHMVCVLPFCSSCDALEVLLKSHKDDFKNLGEYECINIAGHENKLYKNSIDVKRKITECEAEDIKTLTLTVNKMLTGSTVEQWDTMIYLKDTASPQEYDQSIFRLQNQYIRTYLAEDGNVIKYNMKPQTLLVDFAPDRMFQMQELKSQIYNANKDKNGNNELTHRLERELEISPIIVINKGKIEQITATNILDAVRKYSRDKSVMDEALDIPADFSLFNIPFVREYISKLEPINAKKGLSVKPAEGDGDDDWNLPFPDDKPQDNPEEDEDTPDSTDFRDIVDSEPDEKLDKKLATYYSLILFFAFLTNSRVNSLKDIIESIKSSDEIKRIAKNVGLNAKLVYCIQEYSNPYILSMLDYKIQNINSLMYDTSLAPIDRAMTALKKFGRLSDSEIVTPSNVADDVVALLPDDASEGNLLDIATKQGEFTIALYKRWGDKVLNKIYAIPTSRLAYEFAKKIYDLLGMPCKNIFEFNSYEVISDDNSELIKKLEMIQFKAIVGNPPYQDKGGSGGNNDAPIYQLFSSLATKLSPDYISLIIKAAWYSSGRENLLSDFRQYMLNSGHIQKLVTYSDFSLLFSKDVEIKGGCCYYLENKNYNGDCDYTLHQDGKVINKQRKLNVFDVLIRDPMISEIVESVEQIREKDGVGTVDTIISSDTPFGIASNPKTSKKTPTTVYSNSTIEHDIMLYHIERGKRKVEFISRESIKKNVQDIDKYKVFVTGAGGSGNDTKVMGKPEFAPPKSVCSQSYLYASFNTEEEARNFIKYINTRFFRVLLSSLKITQSATSRFYRFIPLQDFTSNSQFIDWSLPIDDIDTQLFQHYKITEYRSLIEEKISSL